MSRIDEALRRAAQDAQDGADVDVEAAATELPGTTEPDDVEVGSLAREPFPIELTNRTAPPHAAKAIAPAPPSPPSDAWQTADSTGPEGTHRPEGARPSLFERLDHTLAEKVVADRNISPVSREQYRRLAAALHDAQSNTGLSSIMRIDFAWSKT